MTLVLGTIVFIIVVFVVIWVLLEAMIYDHQRTRFLNQLKSNDCILINKEPFRVIRVNREKETMLVANIYHEPKWVDITMASPPEGFLTVYRVIIDAVREHFKK
jgi:hypothetical protein